MTKRFKSTTKGTKLKWAPRPRLLDREVCVVSNESSWRGFAGKDSEALENDHHNLGQSTKPGTSWPTLYEKSLGLFTAPAIHNNEDTGDGAYG